MNPLRTVGGRLAVALLVVVACALAIVYIVVVPSYQDSLVKARLVDLGHSLDSIMLLPHASLGERWAENTAYPLANAPVFVFHVKSGKLQTAARFPRGGRPGLLEADPVALRAIGRRATVRGEVVRGEERYAEAANYVAHQGTVVLLSSPLHNDLRSVDVVRRRVLIAGGLATVFAILLGYVLATLFARRIRRLEVAAERIAGGRFDVPVEDAAPDELGELARAFDRMRLQLAANDRAQREFIANASHELRTPLFSLAGFLELLAGEELDAETTAEFLLETRGQVSRLQKLATDLLDLSRLDAASITVARESLDLGPIGEALARELGPRAAATGHALNVEVPAPVPAIGDEDRVLQIGRGLVENALVHTPEGTAVTIAARPANGRAELTVTDNGPGIPAGSQARVFDRFFRLEGTAGPGSGLGLAIASELAALMEGRIKVESRPGWTRFTLALPADVFENPPSTGKRDGRRRKSGASRRIAQV